MRTVAGKIAWFDTPRTGSSTLKAAFLAAGIPVVEVSSHMPVHPAFPQAIMSVRHPSTWIRSAWAWARDHGWDRRYPIVGEMPVTRLERLRDWNHFLIVEELEDLSGALLRFFLEPAFGEVIRAESLITDANAALDRLGVPARLTPPRSEHVSEDLPEIPARTLRSIFLRNRDFFDRFGYRERP